MKTTVVAIFLTIAAVLPAFAAQPVPYLPVPKGAAVILNTGSTNTIGYRIVVDSSGRAEYVHAGGRSSARIPAQIAAKLFADLRAAMPLSSIHVLPCMKSASFGTSTFIWWSGQRSLDLSCPSDAKSQALNDDVMAVARALHLAAAPAGGHVVPMLPNEPRKPLPASSPSPSPLSVRLTARALGSRAA
jgi:hypothetical protein